MIVRHTDHGAKEHTGLARVRTAIAVVGRDIAGSRLGAGALVVGLARLPMLRARRRIERATAEPDEDAHADRLRLVLPCAFALRLSR